MELLQTMSTTFVRYGYLAVFAGVMLENAGLPMPGETILLAAGFFAFAGHFSLPVVIGVGALGATLGDNLGYLVGRRVGRPFVERYGRYVLLSPPKLAALGTFFMRHGAKTVLIARFISGLRVFAAFFAGMSYMPWGTFFSYNAAGAMLWAVTITLLGYFFGQSWRLIELWMGRLGVLILAAVVIGLLFLALLRHPRRRKEAFACSLGVHTRCPFRKSYASPFWARQHGALRACWRQL
jgi:membrane protein DedA with SNARE-associated domain